MADETLLGAQTDTSAADGNNQDQSGDAGSSNDSANATQEKSPDESQSTDTGKAADDGKDQGGAPETYADFTLPEGTTLDKELMDEFTPLAKELNLNQDQAQKLIDMQLKSMGGERIQQAVIAAQEQIVKEQSDQWAKETKEDKEIGGDKLDATVIGAGKFMKTFGSQALRDALNKSGMGDHPELIRAFYKASVHLSEDVFLNKSSSGQGGAEDAASIMYPNETKKG